MKSINGKETSKFKKCIFQKRNRDQKIYTIHHSHFDYEEVLKQDQQVNLLRV